MTTLAEEKLLTISQAAASAPGRPDVRTVWRWIEKGVKGTRLEVLRAGGKTFTSEQAMDRFFQRLSEQGGQADD